jgi:hypothetical protein
MTPPLRLQVVLTTATSAEIVLETSMRLAKVAQLDVSAVFVESAAALQAAALPFTRQLAHAAADWAPFDPADVELAWRAHAERVRRHLAELAARHGVQCALRVARGRLPAIAHEVLAGGDLLLVEQAALPAPRIGRAPRPPRAVVVRIDDSDAGRRALRLAALAATVLGGARPAPIRVELAADTPPALAALRESVRAALPQAQIDGARPQPVSALHDALLIVPERLVLPRDLERLAVPTLLVR